MSDNKWKILNEGNMVFLERYEGDVIGWEIIHTLLLDEVGKETIKELNGCWSSEDIGAYFKKSWFPNSTQHIGRNYLFHAAAVRIER